MAALHPLLDEIVALSSKTDASRLDTTLLVELVRSLRPERGESAVDAQERVHVLIDVLRSSPLRATGLREYVSSVLAARNHFFVYAESGILDNTGFFTELRHRLANRLLPPALDERFLRDLLEELFDHVDDAEWIASIPIALWEELLEVVGFYDPGPMPGRIQIRSEMAEALRVLACRLAALGLEPDLVRYSPDLSRYESPFLAQQREFELVIVGMQQVHADPSLAWPDSSHADVLLDQCREALTRIRKQSHESGAAVRLSWHLTRAFQIIERMRVMLGLLMPGPREEKFAAGFNFFVRAR